MIYWTMAAGEFPQTVQVGLSKVRPVGCNRISSPGAGRCPQPVKIGDGNPVEPMRRDSDLQREGSTACPGASDLIECSPDDVQRPREDA